MGGTMDNVKERESCGERNMGHGGAEKKRRFIHHPQSEIDAQHLRFSRLPDVVSVSVFVPCRHATRNELEVQTKGAKPDGKAVQNHNGTDLLAQEMATHKIMELEDSEKIDSWIQTSLSSLWIP